MAKSGIRMLAIEIDKDLKKQIMQELENRGMTLKGWLTAKVKEELRQAEAKREVKLWEN